MADYTVSTNLISWIPAQRGVLNIPMAISMSAYLVTGRCKLGNECGPGKWSGARDHPTEGARWINEPEGRS